MAGIKERRPSRLGLAPNQNKLIAKLLRHETQLHRPGVLMQAAIHGWRGDTRRTRGTPSGRGGIKTIFCVYQCPVMFYDSFRKFLANANLRLVLL
ncbi:hypothetical protein NDU88_007383 [Pleurodeles waltl]|uniref:Uncharacterized protein n=1 Tax=Pleurodeles waltl TaxID=8319 RepID=A0AAV7U1C1_PLEWA|nr:hypothetical protein NDU88_007383 [Pleurodeles waltl]